MHIQEIHIQEILNFIMTVIWPIVILAILIVFFHPLKNLLISLNNIIRERGVRVSTTGGIEIPSSTEQANQESSAQANQESSTEQDKQEVVDCEIEKTGGVKKLLELNINEGIEEPFLYKNPDVLKSLLKKYANKKFLDINSRLDKLIEASASIAEKQDLYRILIMDAYVSLYFERCFQRILGSQLTLLEFLYKDTEHSSAIDNAKNIYDAEFQNKDDNSFARWTEYLIKAGFIKTNDLSYTLTSLGEEFIQYLIARGYNLHKDG